LLHAVTDQLACQRLGVLKRFQSRAIHICAISIPSELSTHGPYVEKFPGRLSILPVLPVDNFASVPLAEVQNSHTFFLIVETSGKRRRSP